MPLGRPIEYDEKILEKAEEYLTLCQDEEQTQVVGLSAKGTELYKSKLKVKLPSIEGLAIYLGVHRSTIYDWKDKYDRFSDILDKILAEQAQRLINNGLSGDYNPTISKLILTKHGYSDKQETDLTSGGKPIPILGNALQPHNSNSENSES